MIKRNTIIVLGAGGSIPYGYPSGVEILDEMCLGNINLDDMCQLDENRQKHELHESKFSDILKKNGVSLSEVGDFLNKLRYAYPPTIDYFLNQYKGADSYVKFGKLRIANIILKCERKHKNALLLPRELAAGHFLNDFKEIIRIRENQKWYGLFFNDFLRGSNIDDLFNNKINIINFNYDRSFECFVYNHLRNTYKASDFKIYQFFKHIDYKHVYGVVAPIYMYDGCPRYDFDLINADEGKLYFVFNPDKKSPLSYGMINDETFRSISKNILETIEIIDKDRIGKISIIQDNIIKLAEKLCFLGFSYDSTNMELLDLKRFNGGQVEGTVRGVAMKKVNELRGYFNNHSEYYDRINDTNKNEYLKDQDIVSYLKYHAHLD